MKSLIPLLLLAAFAIQGCQLNPSEMKRGFEIDEATRNEINDLDMKVFQYVQAGDLNAFNLLSSAAMKAQLATGGQQEVWNRFTNIFMHRSYRVHDEVYVNSLLPGYKLNIKPERDSDNYEFSMATTTREMDVSFLILEDKASEYLLTIMYGKYNGKWLVNGMFVNGYSVLKKTAPAYYARAKELYNGGDLIDAAMCMNICDRIARPCDTFFKYKNITAMEHFGKKVIQEAVDKYPMPYTLNDVNGKPAIFGIQPQQIKGELLPQVNYISKITVADSVALKKENKEVQKAVGRQFPHFKENNTHILYRAFNDLPSDSKIPESYNFIEDTKQ